MKLLWNRFALILAGCFLLAASGCALFRQPESQIATLDLSHSIQTLTAAAPTAAETPTPSAIPVPETAEGQNEAAVILIPLRTDDPNAEPTLIPTSTPKPAAENKDGSDQTTAVQEALADGGVYNRNGRRPTHPVFRLESIPTPRTEDITYTVVSGDSVAAIANVYQVPVSAIQDRNNLANPELIQIGQTLIIPAVEPEALSIGSAIVPDREIVDGPSTFNPETFLSDYPENLLTNYIEPTPTPYPTAEPGDPVLPAPVFNARGGLEILNEVALENAVNPRILIALLEYQSKTITNDPPRRFLIENYIGALGWRTSLDHQLSWAANTLNFGYYQWKNNRINQWILADDSVVAVDPSVNAGTAALQYLFSKLYGREDWINAIGPDGFRATFESLFGTFSDAELSLNDPPESEPESALPFRAEDEWFFSSGPHYGWASGSPWSAIDFVPGDAIGCSASSYPVTAAADGLVVYSDAGLVVVDLDMDGDARTGWTHLYLHVGSKDRVALNARVRQGDPIGYASCEGGFSSGTHLHFARRYNGQWIQIDGANPLVLSGFEAFSTGTVYDGYLVNGDQVVEAWYYQNDANRIDR